MPPKIRDVLQQLKDAGWQQVGQTGSHRQFKHPVYPGRVTVAGKPSDDVAPGTLTASCAHNFQGRPEEVIAMHYAFVVEYAGNNYSAYVPDLPGCVATGATTTEVQCLIREAIELHLAGIHEAGDAIPLPSNRVEFVDVAV